MKPLPKIAWLLGYAGVIPFALITVLISIQTDNQYLSSLPLALWQSTYAAIILSFIGAVSWGVALGSQEQLNQSDVKKLITYSVVPSILAWFALFLPEGISLFVLSGLIVMAYIVDSILVLPIIKSEYKSLRIRLTFAVSVLLFISAILTL